MSKIDDLISKLPPEQQQKARDVIERGRKKAQKDIEDALFKAVSEGVSAVEKLGKAMKKVRFKI